MKNKIFILLILFFCHPNFLMSEEYNFEVSKIELKNKGNLINAYDGKISSKNNDIKIFAKQFLYLKNEDLLKAFDGTAIIKKENLKLKFNSIKVRNKNILSANNGIKIKDLDNSLEIEGETFILDRTKNILISPTKSILYDKYNNSFETGKFEYQLINKKIKIYDAEINDFDKNKFQIKSANIDLKSDTLVGNNININLNNKFLNPENEPRISGDSIKYSDNITSITNGKFTPCKKRDKCPPWELSADEIRHDRNKKTISYKNVWLNIYDKPVVYFPKFFHPDPTVKRQSGFLMPAFKNSPNNNTFFSIPYFKVIDKNKDMTFTPRLYAKNKILVQNEYREVNKNSKFISDFSILSGKNSSESHLFLNFNKYFSTQEYKNSNVDLTFEQVSNDTYLKANKLTSPIIKNLDVLENSLKVNMSSENTKIKSEFIIYENLNRKRSDKYEYIFPRVELVKNLQNKTKLNGNFEFKTNSFIHNYNTNIYEKVNTNNLIFTSTPKITKKGFNNNFEFIVKNSNTDSQKTKINKEGNDYYLSSLFQINSKYPLIKRNEKYKNLFTPKMSLKLSPGHSKDLSKNEYRLNVDNIFDLDRISSNDTLEGGASLTYGTDYILSKKIDNKELLSLKVANNLRLNKNNKLERNNQLHDKTSNFFGQIRFSPLNFLTAKYELSTLNNLSDINYQNLTTEIKFDKFTNTFDFLEQDGDENSYFLNKMVYKFDDSNHISFSTRENLEIDLTEYYNLVYQYKNDCLAASIEYQKDFYRDRDIKPSESIFLKLTIIPFGTTSTPNLKQ